MILYFEEFLIGKSQSYFRRIYYQPEKLKVMLALGRTF